MKRLAILGLAAACTAPAPSALKPSVEADTDGSNLYVTTTFDRDPDVEIEATFRGKRSSLRHDGHGDYNVRIALDHPLEGDEPLDIDVDGISMTMTAPPDFGDVQEPLFISRSHDTTVSWAQVSADPIYWYVLLSACAQSPGGELPPGASSLTLTQADWPPLPDSPGIPSTCTTDIRLIRHRETPADPAFAGGETYFAQIYDLQFASMP